MMGDGKEKWQDELCACGSTCLDGSVTGGPLGNEVAVVASFPDTRVAYKLFTMGCMLLLTGVVVAYVRYGRRDRFSFLPHT